MTVDIFITCGKHLHDRIISLKGKVWAHTISVTPSRFIEVSVPSWESERSCIYVLRILSMPLFVRLFHRIV